MNIPTLRQRLLLIVCGLTAAAAVSGCDPASKSSTSVNRPKTTATTADGFNPQLQSVTKADNSNGLAQGDESFGAVAIQGQFILNFTVVDTGRSLNFQTVQASTDIGSDSQSYNGRFDYILDSECVDSNCTQIMVLLSQTENTSGKSFQSAYFVADVGHGLQVIKTTMGTSFDSIDDALAGTVDGPPVAPSVP